VAHDNRSTETRNAAVFLDTDGGFVLALRDYDGTTGICTERTAGRIPIREPLGQWP